MYKLLTNREYDVLTRLHKTNQQIAEELFVSVNTITTIVQRIQNKLDAKNRTEMVIKAIKVGLVDINSFD
jgi:DNA-binding NarL/FixJ family response regulator